MKQNKKAIIKLISGEMFIFEPGAWEDIIVSHDFIKIEDGETVLLVVKKDTISYIRYEKLNTPKNSPVNGWIPIDEKKPAPEEEVLFCNIHGLIFIGERADFLGKNIFIDSAKTISTTAAAWMPLPEKYKGAVDNGN